MVKRLQFFLLSLCVFYFLPLAAEAQTLAGLSSSFDGERVTIQYDLTDKDAGQKYKVSFFGSHDGYAKPLTFISGDVGDNVLPGKGKKAIWLVRSVLPATFDADVTIKVKASKLIPVVQKIEPAVIAADPGIEALNVTSLDKSSYKKGGKILIQWKGGAPADKINVELLKGGAVLLKSASQINNDKRYTITLPKEIEKGSDYALRVSNAAKSDQKSTSSNFSVKSKLPLLVKLAPIAVVGVILAAGGSKGSGDTSGGTTAVADLPGPVKP